MMMQLRCFLLCWHLRDIGAVLAPMDLAWFFETSRKSILIFKRYQRAILIFLSVYVFLGCLSIYGYLNADQEKRSVDVTPFMPLEGLYTEPMLASVVYPVTAILGALLGGYVLSPLYLLVHKLMYRKVVYGILKEAPPEKFKTTLSGWYPTLLAFHINSILLLSNPGLSSWFLGADLIAEIESGIMRELITSIFLMTLTIGLGVMVFSPVWFLLDSGIVYSTREHVKGMGRPFEVRAVGGWFHDYLRGYAGFGIALSFILILIEYFTKEVHGPFLAQIPDISWMFGLPVLIALTVIPALIVLDIVRNHRIAYVRKVAGMLGITDSVLVSYKWEGSTTE